VLSQATVTAGHLWVEGLVFRRGPDGANGLVAKGSPENVVIARNQFHGFHYSILLSHQSQDWYIADNTIVGDKENPAVSDTSGEGIELNHSSGHSVAFNRISHTADGISYPHRNGDLYGNDIRDLTDDGIEPDYGYANVRLWGNRIHGAFNNGVSFQPMYCGPWYILRNEIFSRKGMLKPNVADRFLLTNNTFVVQSRYAQDRADRCGLRWLRLGPDRHPVLVGVDTGQSDALPGPRLVLSSRGYRAARPPCAQGGDLRDPGYSCLCRRGQDRPVLHDN
jgi:hypothetical protein